jgi:uncharacterized protein YneF (UPF0154 family)
MAIIQVPLAKAKGKFIDIDTDKVNADVWAYAVSIGLKSLANRGTAGEKAKGLSDDEYLEIAAKQVADMYAGKTRIIGAKRAAKRDGAEMTEAIRIAKETVKQMIRANGEKISHYSASEITKAAKAIVEADPDTYLGAAQENLARAAGAVAKGGKADILGFIKPSEAKVKAAEAKKAATKTEVSAAQAGKVVKSKPGPRVHA